MTFLRRKLPTAPALPLGRRSAPRPPAAPPVTDRLVAAVPPPTRPAASAGSGVRVLVVCTANICRSPLGEALLSRVLRDEGVEAAVSSAGVSAANQPVDPRSVAAAARIGVDLSGHRSRQLTAGLLADDGRDLVLTMTREHLREVAVLDPSALRRTFTFRELVRRAGATPPRSSQVLAGWIEELAAGRRPSELLGESPADDIADPYGRSDAMFAEMATELERLCRQVGALSATVTHSASG